MWHHLPRFPQILADPSVSGSQTSLPWSTKKCTLHCQYKHTHLRSIYNRSKLTAQYFLQLQGGGVTVMFSFLYRYCLCPTKLIPWTTYGWWSSTRNILPSSAVPCEVVFQSLSARARELWCLAEKPTAHRGSEFIWDVHQLSGRTRGHMQGYMTPKPSTGSCPCLWHFAWGFCQLCTGPQIKEHSWPISLCPGKLGQGDS